MKTLKIVAIISFLAFISQSLSAQQKGKPSPEKVAERQTKWMVKELSLTENQRVKVAAINLNYAKQIAEVRRTVTDNKARRQKVKSLNDSKMLELKTVLTPEQYNLLVIKLDEKKKDAKENRQQKNQQK